MLKAVGAVVMVVGLAGAAGAEEAPLIQHSDQLQLGARGRAADLVPGPSTWTPFQANGCFIYYDATLRHYVTQMNTTAGRSFSVLDFDNAARQAFHSACLAGATVFLGTFTYSDGTPGWNNIYMVPKQ